MTQHSDQHSDQCSLKWPHHRATWMTVSPWRRQATISSSRLRPTSSGPRLWCNRSRWWKSASWLTGSQIATNHIWLCRTLPSAVLLELSLDIRLWLRCATPSPRSHIGSNPQLRPPTFCSKPRPCSTERPAAMAEEDLHSALPRLTLSRSQDSLKLRVKNV